MYKKKITALVFILISVFSYFSCVSQPATPQINNEELLNLISNSCYEVVVDRIESDNIVYEKDLPWDDLPYQIRNDEYYSIGTAFAISPYQFLTASHVLEFGNNSLVYKDYYLRDANGNVYKITEIEKFHNVRDFAIFTVEDFTSPDYIEIREESFRRNEPVYQIGNIYGQGIVAVPGTILGTIPESLDGEWDLIKSSPPNDHGSSGGPLLDEDLKLVGLITMKDDNFCYSTPINEITSFPEDTGLYSIRHKYSFNLAFNENTDIIKDESSFELPMNILDIKEKIQEDYYKVYEDHMNVLFDQIDGLFPYAPGSLPALYDSRSSSSLQVFARNDENDEWFFSDLEKDSSDLGKDGYVYYSNAGGLFYFDLIKPKDLSHNELYSSSKNIFDMLLSAVKSTRTFNGEEIRILSYGEPFMNETYTDQFGRTWFMDYWLVEYNDSVCILLWTPTPDGLVGIIQFTLSSAIEGWSFDLSKIADLLIVPYTADLDSWKGYLAHPYSDLGPYKDLEFEFVEDEYLSLSSNEITLEITSDEFEINDEALLSLTRDVYPMNNEITWGLRRVSYSERGRDNYFVLYRHLKPVEDLRREYHRKWDGIVDEKYPYDGVSFNSDGITAIGAIHSQTENQDVLSTLYLGQEGSRTQEEMEELRDSLLDSIEIYY